MSRLGWLLVGLLIGAGAATLLARRTAARAPVSSVERAALTQPTPAPSGRHAWVPPSESSGPSAG